MVNVFTKAFQTLDIFGSGVGLNYNQNNVFKTTIGGLFSLVFVGFIGLFFWSNLQNVYSTTTKIFQTDPDPIELNSSKFMFAVKIDQDDFLTKPMLNVTLEKRDYVTYPNGTKTRNKYPVQLEQCTLNHFMKLPSYGVNWTEEYQTLLLEQYLCPPISEILMLGGNYNSEHFYHWKFTVSKCRNDYPKNQLWKPTCQTDKEISDYFNTNPNVRLTLYLNNYLINPLQNNNYVSNYVEDTITFAIQRTGVYQNANIYFTESVVETDQSILPFQDIQTEHYSTYQSGNIRQQYVIGPTSDIYADIFIRKDAITYVYNRSFQKISEIISYIGGFAQIFIIITAVIVNYYNQYVYAISLANKIYDFEYGKKKNKQRQSHKFQGVEQFQKIKVNQSSGIQKDNNDFSEQQQNLSSNLQNKQIQNEQVNIEFKGESAIDSKDLINSPHQNKKKKKSKKITTREEDGLLPLDKIKSIITQRQTVILEKRKTKFMKNKASNEYDPEFKLDNDDKQKDQHQNDNGEQLKHLNDEENGVNEDNSSLVQIRQKQFTNQFYANMQTNSEQIGKKNVFNDSIDPESPSTQKHKKQQEKINEKLKEKYGNKKQQQNTTNQTKKSQSNQNESNQNNNQQSFSPFLSNVGSPEFSALHSNSAIYKEQIKQDLETQRKQQNDENSPTLNSPHIQGLLEGLGFNDKNQFLNREFEFLLKRKKSIHMSYQFFLYKMTCGKLFRSEQAILLDRAHNQMQKDLDIIMILNRIKELEKFKALFLDKNQQILFDFFPKPILSIDQNNENLSRAEMIEHFKKNTLNSKYSKNLTKSKQLTNSIKTFNLEQNSNNKQNKDDTQSGSMDAYEKLYDAYEAIKEQGDENIFNRKLIKLLGEEMNKIFEISDMLEFKKQKQKEKVKDVIENKQIEADQNMKNLKYSQSSMLSIKSPKNPLITHNQTFSNDEQGQENKKYMND